MGLCMNDSKTKDKIERLCQDHFPWGKNGNPPVPSSPQERETHVCSWLDKFTIPYRAAALALTARMVSILNVLESELPDYEKPRFFAKIDASSITKSPASLLDKMVRGWDHTTGNSPQFSFDNLHSLADVGRFRIVANFLSDVRMIAKKIGEPYTAKPATELPEHQGNLKEEYHLEKKKFENLIDVLPEKRNKGERCFKGVFYPTKGYKLNIEVQIQTLLQEAWDKKDHFLVYEPRRRSEAIQDHHQIEIFSMSEVLYTADLTFDRLKESMLKQREDLLASHKKQRKRG
jgi:ppGpp synthetase/RelA/SpoT-type nucleotidyltranferase